MGTAVIIISIVCFFSGIIFSSSAKTFWGKFRLVIGVPVLIVSVIWFVPPLVMGDFGGKGKYIAVWVAWILPFVALPGILSAFFGYSLVSAIRKAKTDDK